MPRNLWLLVEHSLKTHTDQPAWICRQRGGRRVVTYKQLYEAVLTTADKLRELGVHDSDTVGVTAPNGPEFTVAALAAWKIGANIAPIHIGNSDHEIAKQIDALSPKIMLVHDSSVQYDRIMPISMEVEADRISREAAAETNDDPDKLAVRIYTSGSTGNPKVVMLSHGNHASNVMAACKIEEFNESDRFISLLPFSHAMALTANLLLPLYHGSAVVAPRVLAANEILETLQQENISVVIAVPRLFRNVMLGLEKKFAGGGKGLALYRALMKMLPVSIRQHINAPIRKKFGGKIKAWVSGGSHLDGRITQYYHDLGLPLRQGYGLTETSPLISIQENFDTSLESVGKPVDQIQVKIYNPDKNGSGEIWIKGPNVMIGYEDQQQTSEVMEDGWFKSGDIARLDSEGRIILTGRSKRLMVTEAGKNIYPEELETLLERDPMVKEAGVFEVEMKPVCVLAMDGDNPSEEARRMLKEFNRLVSSHNQITRFAIVEELPRTPLGKMALRELPAMFHSNEVK